MLNMLSFDLGATNGRAIIGSFDGNRVSVKEIHRFPNHPVFLGDKYYWDALRLLQDIKDGISKSLISNNQIASLGIDTWGGDFGLLDEQGDLIGNPYHYRNMFPFGTLDETLKTIPYAELYKSIGADIIDQYAIMVLSAMSTGNFPQLKYAKTLLMMPDLFNYFLSGEKAAEYTSATASRMISPETKNWNYGLLERLGLPTNILAPIVQAGTVLGNLTPSVQDEIGCSPIKVIATVSHDSAAAVAALPNLTPETTFISSGTWSVMGIESNMPLITEKGMQYGFINEGSICGKTRFLKLIMGLYFVECCRSNWEAKGEGISYDEMAALAQKSTLFRSFIDPTDIMSFIMPNDIPQDIQQYCSETGQVVPESKGDIICTILQSLAMEYRRTIEQLQEISGRKLNRVFIVGGGVKNKLLCQYTANATGKVVYAGYSETVCVGNILTQAMALGEINGLDQLRQVVKDSFEIERYEPKDTNSWDAAYETYLRCKRS